MVLHRKSRAAQLVSAATVNRTSVQMGTKPHIQSGNSKDLFVNGTSKRTTHGPKSGLARTVSARTNTIRMQIIVEITPVCRRRFIALASSTNTGRRLEANRGGHGGWGRNAVSAGRRGFQNSGKGFLNQGGRSSPNLRDVELRITFS